MASSIPSKTRQLKELRETKKSLSSPAAKASVDKAIERKEREIARAAAKVGKRPARKRGIQPARRVKL